MSRYIDADKLLNRFMDYVCHDFACEDCKARYYPSGICRVDKMLREFPTADVVSKEKYDELNERYHRLLENAKILSDVVREYEREK